MPNLKKKPPWFNFQNDVFNTLSMLLINCCNFKVRHVACVSLMFNQRDLYGNNYIKMWHRLFDAFENSQNLPHACEYKHQQKLTNQVGALSILGEWGMVFNNTSNVVTIHFLVSQLCALFCNLCGLLEPADVGNLTYLFDSRLHMVQNEMEKFCNFIDVPNYRETLATTHSHLRNTLKTKSLSSKQVEIVNSLLNIFDHC